MEERLVPFLKMPIYRSMTEPMLTLGVPMRIFIFNGMIFAMFFFVLHVWYMFPLNLVMHYVAVRFAKKDAMFLDCYKRYIKKKDYYCV